MWYVIIKESLSRKRCIVFYQYRQYRRGGGVCLFVKESFCCKTRRDLAINCDATKSLCLEITNQKSKNIFLNLTCRSPNGDLKEFEKHLNKKMTNQQMTANNGWRFQYEPA